MRPAGGAPPLREMIERLVAIPSVSSVEPALDLGNRPIAECLAGWLEDLGFACRLQEVAGRADKLNLIARLGPGGDERPAGLILSGHTDTVPCDEALWTSDPFRAVERHGRLYGLGTCDMKSFLAIAAEAARGLRPDGLREPLVIVATADEESGMSGAKALVDAGVPRGGAAVVGEPTGLRPVRTHKGILMEAIRVIGSSGHSSDPSLGRNAIDAMARVLEALTAWREELATTWRDPAFAVPYPTLNFGRIFGGDNPNRICGEAELHIDLRPLPGMDPEALRAELRRRVEAAVGETAIDVAVRSLTPGLDPMATPPEAPIVRAAEALTGARAGGVAFGTEAPFLARLGAEVVVLGPGDIAQAHQPDEYLALDTLEPAVELLRRLIDRFCLGP